MWGISVASGTPAASAASVGARVRMSATTTAGSRLSISGSSARAASAACRPSSVSGSGGGKMRYSSAATKSSPAPSTAARRSSQVSIVTSWPRRASARPSEIAGKTWPGSPKAATRTRSGRSLAARRSADRPGRVKTISGMWQLGESFSR